MNFVFKSAYAPVGSRPIHHWTMSRLLKQFGVATIEPPKPKDKIRQKDIADQCGTHVRTIQDWKDGHVPRQVNKKAWRQCCKLGGLRKSVFCKRKKYGLWDLWDMVKARWKQLSRMLHPDVNRASHAEFATMCRIYLTLKERFRKRGIA